MKSIGSIFLVAAILSFPVLLKAQTVSDGSLTVTSILKVGTLEQPTAMMFLGIDDMLVAEKSSGQVKRVTNGVVSNTIALNLAVNNQSERGLLSLAPDPSFATNHFVYVYYTPSSTTDDTSDNSVGPNHIIARYTWNSGTGLLESRQVIVSDIPDSPGPNHDAGIIIFGPPSDAPANRKLFAITGDLNRDNHTENYTSGGGADGSGSIIRINRDGTTPSDDPFFNVAGANSFLKRQYAYGIRNSFGMTFDALSTAPNKLWMTENGPDRYDEINLVAPAFNSGWENTMGPLSANNFEGANGSLGNFVTFGGIGTYSDPEFSFKQPIAITSILFFTGAGLGPAYVGDCFVGDVNNKRIFKFEMNQSRTGFVFANPLLQDLVYDNATDASALPEILFGTDFGQNYQGGPTSIQTGPDGFLYVTTIGDGQIYRISHAPTVSQWNTL